MYIEKLSLTGFRNLKDINLKLNNGINIFFGENAQGKTNILESIYICSTGRSHRTRSDSQLINFIKQESHIQLYAVKEKRKDRIDVHIKRDEKKGIAINGIAIKKSGELFGTLYTVIFSPEDLNLIKEGPSERRRFMDIEICQINNIYYYDLQQYYKVLKQRNNLLKKIQINPSLKETLFVWDKQLLEYGEKIINSREKFIKKLSKIAAKEHKKISGDKEILEINYKPSCNLPDLAQKMNNYLERDIIYGSTQIGPHKDDISFLINGNDVKIYGSQGQQRTTALSCKLAEIELIKNETGYTPVLLLDDVLSELDKQRQKYLLDNIDKIQVIITCTGIEDSINKYKNKSFIFSIKDGDIYKQNN